MGIRPIAKALPAFPRRVIQRSVNILGRGTTIGEAFILQDADCDAGGRGLPGGGMEWFFSRSFRVLAEVLIMDPEIIYLWTLDIRIPNGVQEVGSGWIYQDPCCIESYPAVPRHHLSHIIRRNGMHTPIKSRALTRAYLCVRRHAVTVELKGSAGQGSRSFIAQPSLFSHAGSHLAFRSYHARPSLPAFHSLVRLRTTKERSRRGKTLKFLVSRNPEPYHPTRWPQCWDRSSA